MRHITPDRMLPFLDELSKTAGWSDTLARVGKRVVGGIAGSGGYGTRVAVGAGVGAATGAALDEENRVRGALIGGGLGGGAVGASVLATPGGRKAIREWPGKFWQRQKYSLTGRGVSNVGEARRLGIMTAKPEAKAFKKAEDYQKALSKWKETSAHETEAFKKGYLHAPGVVKGLFTKPGETLKSSWQRAGWPGKAFAGLGLYSAGSGFAKKPEEGGPGRIESGLRGLGQTAGILVSPATLGGGLVLSEGLGQAGKYLGRGVDRLVGKVRSPVAQPAPTNVTGA